MNIKYPYFNEDHEGIREMAKDFACLLYTSDAADEL